MKTRLITGIILIGILVPLVLIEELFLPLQIVFILFALVGSHEMLKLYSKERKFSWKIKIVAMFSTVLIYSAILNFWSGNRSNENMTFAPNLNQFISWGPNVGLAMVILAVLLQLSLLVFSQSFDGKDIGKTLSTSIYIGFGVSSIMMLRLMGVRFIVYLFLITIMTDVFAYVFGMLFGKHKMIERISPKKTWEGAVGGTVMATVVAGLFALLYGSLFENEPITIFHLFSKQANGEFVDFPQYLKVILIFGVTLCASIVSQVGDLVASRLKRTYDVKDFGNIFPGHGGFLDRFDSAILTAMFLLMVFLIINEVFGATILMGIF